ncbi:ABC transporter substrate-binding protein [Pelagibacterium xiamenense]|uniref:ABC transporter substrate-binding protein n=1 Tax=Pelagibacterium xiamenense TaxID=2901140 RepID=UPI001E5994B3|nr:extracellular solute-binding protein [Pelagibacterium xiamenense]MCD7061128.1 extracellular solute-binding protein [Pelagibacterium xiamenense]
MTRSNFPAVLLGGTAVGLLALGAGAASAQDTVNLTLLIDNSADTVALTEQLVADFEARNPNIDIEIETRPGGGEGDNIVKTRLATGQMTDIFLYNSGSLLQALAPSQTLVPLTDQPFLDRVLDSFESTVTSGGDVYGVPVQTAMGGGILYNRDIYEELDLEIPMTWDAFMANNATIAEAGYVPVIQTYRDTWTSQLFVLADFYNVLAEEPDFAERYTANEAKYATSDAALEGFRHLAEVHEAGYMNEDFGAATYDDGLRMLSTGEGAHYPMLTFAIAAIEATYPENLDSVGFFAQPGSDPEINGLTTWMPAALYVPKTTSHPEEAMAFLDFVASVDGCNAITEAVGATGPYLVEGCDLPSDVPAATADMLPYFEEDGRTAPALEFLSPVKGPTLEQLTVEVGSGIRSPEDAAALYDQDVERQAQQLGLEGW